MPQLGQRGGQLAAGADAELGEYLAQVPLDRARGQEQRPGGDAWVVFRYLLVRSAVLRLASPPG
jgi:hypothetical protein